jgi:hypothetical protein
VFHEFFLGNCSKIIQKLVTGQLNFEDHSAERNLRLKLEGLKISSSGYFRDTLDVRHEQIEGIIGYAKSVRFAGV